MKQVLIALLVVSLLMIGQASPQLVLVLVHEGRTPGELGGTVPHQAAWLLWKRVPAANPGSTYSSEELESNVRADPWLPSRVVTFATGKRVAGRWADILMRLDSAPFEGGSAGQAFRRRTGWQPPHPALLAMNAGGLMTRGLLSHTLGARLERAGKRGLYLYTPQSPPPSPYALIGVGSHGFLPTRAFRDFESLRIAIPTLDADWVLIEMTHWDYAALELLIAEGIETWVISLQPSDPGLDGVARLTAVVRYAARERHGLLTSASTRWAGMVLEVDIVPTLVRAIAGERSDWRTGSGTPAFDSRLSDWHAFWNGLLPRTATRALRHSLGLSEHRGALTRIEEHWRVQHEMAPVILASVALIGTLWVLSGLLLWRLGHLNPLLRSLYRIGLAVLLLFPAVSIWHSYCPFELWTGDVVGDASVIVGWLVGGWVGLAMAMAVLARITGMPPLSAAGAVVLGVILLDIYFGGGYGVNRSLLALYLWEGARLYGLDNTYLGIALPLALLVPASWLESLGCARPGPRGMIALTACYALLMLTFGLPMLGSNLGAWMPMMLAFGLMLTYYSPLTTHYSLLAVFFTMGVGATVFAAWLDAHQHWRLQSHFGRAWQELAAGNLSPLLQAKLDVLQRVVVSLPMMVAVIGFALFVFALYQWFRTPLVQLWHGAVAMRPAVYASAWGALAALLCNDSGLVTAALIAGCVVLWMIDALLNRVEWHRPATNGHLRIP
ncbi:hypothetical protein HRbin15_02661 [bacterium HR15]|nr:hypothetical protein HRbin15_02661 [bacterium HR15]